MGCGSSKDAPLEGKGAAANPIDRTFIKFDTDKDGFISLDELKAGLKTQGATDDHVKGITEELLARYDINGDKKLDKTEFEFMVTSNKFKLAVMDTDADGFLSLEELKAGVKIFDASHVSKITEESFKKYDANADGKLDLAEFEAMANALHLGFTLSGYKLTFKKYDSDRDGHLTLDELKAGLTSNGGSDAAVTEEAFKHYDKNGDGKLDITEFKALCEDVAFKFKIYDADSDGFVTQDELKAGLKAFVSDRLHKVTDEAFTKYDANKDNKLDLAEFTKMVTELKL